MCGFVGIWSRQSIDEDIYHKLIHSISHRGPDAEGFWASEDKRFIVAHSRLSIIDTSEEANQPFLSSDERYVLAYNGEIYNFKKIREKLESGSRGKHEILNRPSDAEFRSRSDTEVLLKAIMRWGPECLPELNGMFSFTLFDQQRNRLLLARDHAGIKPLYWYEDKDMLAFASEIKGLLAIPGLPEKLTMDMASIQQFLHVGYIPGPHSIYHEIKKFPQGHFAEVDHDLKISFTKWWSIDDQIVSNAQSDMAVAEVEIGKLVEDSVRLRLIADVPVGSFLSGGTDSSLVTAIAQKYSSKKFQTFTIGFDDRKFDESSFARQVAEKLGTDHHEYILKEAEAMNLLLDILPTYDEPYADSSAIPTMLISKLARNNVKVVLTGDGGDELFHGYGAYRWAQRLSSKGGKFLASGISSPMRRFGSPRLQRISHLLRLNETNFRSHIFSQENYFFAQDEIKDLLTGNVKLGDREYLDGQWPRDISEADKQALYDLKYYLPDELLVKVDRATMRYGLEARVPLLDKRLIAYAINLDSRLKGFEKQVLKNVLYKYLPKRLFERKKWGFGIPLARWLKTDMNHLVGENLRKETIEDVGILNPDTVSDYITRFQGGEEYLYNRIWSMINLQIWARKYKPHQTVAS